MAMRMSDRSFGHSSSREVLTAYIGKFLFFNSIKYS